MKRPSLTLILSGIFIAYIGHSMWVLSQLFAAPKCTDKPCYTSFLSTNPKLQLLLFTSVQNNPVSKEVTKIATINNFKYRDSFLRLVSKTNPEKGVPPSLINFN